MIDEKELTPEEAEDVLAEQLARLFISQIRSENEHGRIYPETK